MTLFANNLNIWNNVRDSFPHPYTIDDARQFIETANGPSENRVFAITTKEGIVGVTGIHPFKGIYKYSAEVGYWIGEPFWGQGIATESVKWITNFAWTQTDLVRLEAGVFSFNKASMRVLEKCGYSLEAIKRKALFKNGSFHDEHSYVHLRPENY